MANVIPAAPVKAFPVVVAGLTGPTGPAAPSLMLEDLRAEIATLKARMAALEETLRGRG